MKKNYYFLILGLVILELAIAILFHEQEKNNAHSNSSAIRWLLDIAVIFISGRGILFEKERITNFAIMILAFTGMVFVGHTEKFVAETIMNGTIAVLCIITIVLAKIRTIRDLRKA